MRALTCPRFEGSSEMRWAHASHRGYVSHSEILIYVRVDEIHHARKTPLIDWSH
jgi:hypothetical protein